MTDAPEADPTAKLLTAGQRLGEWVLEAPLGRGSYAEVWRARHNALPDRRAAIKVPHDPAYAALLRSEGVLQRRVEGEHVVRVQGLDPEHDPPYLVVDLLEGGTLRERIEAGPIPPADALRLLDELARGLEAARELGVVDRDLKPENVLLDAQGRAHVADFGLGLAGANAAELLDASLASGDHQALAGTLRYMAPEQREPGETVDGRADLYALGVILFELLTAEAPCGGELPSDVLPGLAPRLDELYRRLCARLPARIASAAALRAELAALRAAPPATPPDPALAGAARGVEVPAGLPVRAFALLIDLAPFLWLGVIPRFGRGLGLVGLVALFVIYDLVAVAIRGRTVGKWLAGLRITRTDGAPLDPAQAIQREAFRLLAFATFGLTALPLLGGWAPLHDALAGTRVVHQGPPRREPE